MGIDFVTSYTAHTHGVACGKGVEQHVIGSILVHLGLGSLILCLFVLFLLFSFLLFGYHRWLWSLIGQSNGNYRLLYSSHAISADVGDFLNVSIIDVYDSHRILGHIGCFLLLDFSITCLREQWLNLRHYIFLV